MATGFGAICTDFYVNQKLALKLDLPTERETVLGLFDRVRREIPSLTRFRRYDGELALESEDQESSYDWLALRRNTLRSGSVNPESFAHAYKLHRLVHEISPYFLSISPLDVESLELTFGFDLEAQANRNEVVFDVLQGDSPLAGLVDRDHEHLIDSQPFMCFSLDEKCDYQAVLEVKARTSPREITTGTFEDEPISVLFSVRYEGVLTSLDEMGTVFDTLARHVERITEDRIVPRVVQPIRDAIFSRPQ